MAKRTEEEVDQFQPASFRVTPLLMIPYLHLSSVVVSGKGGTGGLFGDNIPEYDDANA